MVEPSRGKYQRTELLARGSSFVRIFFLELMRTELKIPPEFVRDVLKEVPNKMVLHCESGGPWPVNVISTGNGNNVFLSDGWQRFVEDNLLQRHHFLHFTYDGATRLVVRIFEETGLERDYFSASRNHQEGATSVHHRIQSQKEHSAIKKEVVGCSTPKHPSFEKQIRHYNVARPFTLFLPKKFADEHFSEAKTVRLENAKGEAWQVNCKNHGKQYVFVGGWKGFAEDNKLEVGDTCKFELVDKRTLQVHVFPALQLQNKRRG